MGGTYLVSLPWTNTEIQNYIDKLISYGAWEEITIHGKRAVVADLTNEHRADIKMVIGYLLPLNNYVIVDDK